MKMNYRLFSKCIGLTSTGYLFLKINSINELLYAKELENEKLISVFLITRHGARTPLKRIPGIEEVKPLSFLYINKKFI